MDDITSDKFVELVQDAETNGRQVMVLFEDKDGNWRGARNIKGKETFVRDIGPETVLQLLLTHNGKTNS